MNGICSCYDTILYHTVKIRVPTVWYTVVYLLWSFTWFPDTILFLFCVFFLLVLGRASCQADDVSKMTNKLILKEFRTQNSRLQRWAIFELSKSNLNLKCSDCKASKIIWNDIKVEPIPWELNIENKLFSICVGVWVGGHLATNFSFRPKDAQENSTSFDTNVITGGITFLPLRFQGASFWKPI